MADEFERCLLIGVLALRGKLIDRASLLELLQAWEPGGQGSAREFLEQRGILSGEDLDDLERKVSWLQERPENAVGYLITDGGPGEGLKSPAVTQADDFIVIQGDDNQVDADSPTVAGSEPTLTVVNEMFDEAPSEGPRSRIRYRILEQIAKGGLGEIYSAQDVELNRVVALKLIQERHARSKPSRERFLLEAEITSDLEHPGVVPVHGQGFLADGRPYYTMRLIKGEQFKDAVLRFHEKWASGRDRTARTLELRQLLRRLLDVCNVVDYAHSRKILHRDLKPSNILLGSYGETLVVDWGLAKDVESCAKEALVDPTVMAQSPVEEGTGSDEKIEVSESASRQNSVDRNHACETMPGMALGTPHYMSPEQAAGRADQIGTATDVYGLGATLYFLLTANPPCGGTDVAKVLENVQAGNIAPPHQLCPWVSEPLAAICLKAMSLRPEDRYASPRELSRDIEHWLADEPVSVYQDRMSVRLTRWGYRHQTLAVAVGVLLVSAIAGLLLGNVALSRANRVADEQRDIAQVSARTLERRLYLHRLNLAHRECLENNITQAERLLALCPWSLRGWEWMYIAALCHQERLSFNLHDECVNAVAFSPDGTLMVSGSGKPYSRPRRRDRAELILWDPATGDELRRFEGLEGSVHGAEFSPDGRLIASASGYYGTGLERGGLLRVWDTATGGVVFEHAEELNALCVEFSSDGRFLAAGFGHYSTDQFPGHFIVFEVSSGHVIFDQKLEVGGVNALSFHPDGQRLAVAGTGVVELWDVVRKEKLRELTGHASWVYDVDFHPDGRHLASGGWDRTIRLWDLSSYEEVKRIDAHRGHVLSVAFSPDGKTLASSGEDSAIHLWDATTGDMVTSLRGHAQTITGVLALSFSPDSSLLASAGGDHTVKFWNLKQAGQTTFRQQKGWITSLIPLPDGKSVISASGDHSIAQWDAETGLLQRRFQGHERWVMCLGLSPDGKRIASGGEDPYVQIWDIASGQPVQTLDGLENVVRSVAFSPDGQGLVTATSTNDYNLARSEVALWDLATRKRVRILAKDIGAVSSLAFNPDGQSLALVIARRDFPEVVPSKVMVFDWPSCIERFTVIDPQSAAESSTESLTGTTLAYSPDGRLLAVDGAGGVIRIHDAQTGRLERTLAGHLSQVNSLAFSPDGRRIASGGFDTLIKIWDPATGEELLSLRGHDGGVISLANSLDGLRLFSGGVDWTARVWDARFPITMELPGGADEGQRP